MTITKKRFGSCVESTRGHERLRNFPFVVLGAPLLSSSRTILFCRRHSLNTLLGRLSQTVGKWKSTMTFSFTWHINNNNYNTYILSAGWSRAEGEQARTPCGGTVGTTRVTDYDGWGKAASLHAPSEGVRRSHRGEHELRTHNETSGSLRPPASVRRSFFFFIITFFLALCLTRLCLFLSLSSFILSFVSYFFCCCANMFAAGLSWNLRKCRLWVGAIFRAEISCCLISYLFHCFS